MTDLPLRLWRARRRHDHIDAELTESSSGCELRFTLNDQRLLIARQFADAEAARAEAATQLSNLQRVGWGIHW